MSAKKDTLKNTALRKCFQALVDRKQLNINLDILKIILRTELQVKNYDSLDEKLQTVLPQMLIVYIRNWPGWQKSIEYFSGKLDFREWFLKFRQYIIVKLNYIIKNGFNEVMAEITAERSRKENEVLMSKCLTERGTQTDFLAPKGTAPFKLLVECSPNKSNSLVFTDKGNDILLIHHLETEWSDIGIKELLNWPHIGVEFVSSHLSFKRFNRSEYRRFINFTSCQLTPETSSLIEEVKVVDPAVVQKCFSLYLLWAYGSQYLDILRCCNKIDPSRLEDIENILEEFLKDIHEWELNNAVASNTSVLFNIGGGYFTRNKKVNKDKSNPSTGKGKTPEIGYSEIFIPKMETELTYFNDVQDCSTPDVTFAHLNSIKKLIEEQKMDAEVQVPILVFSCLFCNIKYNSKKDILEHIKNEHGMESKFICSKCLRHLNISLLTRNRWKHSCNNNKT